MRVRYLLEGMTLYGGVKVVLQHVRALRRRGIDALALSLEPVSDWFPQATRYARQVPSFAPEHVAPADIVIGTMWRTVPAACAVPGATPFHFCQCYEGLYEGARDSWPEIEAAYRLPAKKLAASPHLAAIIEERTGQPAAWIPQPFEPDLFCPPGQERGDSGPLRVLLAGHFTLDIKGVEWAMRALRPLRGEARGLQLVRLSIEATGDERALWPAAEFHLHVSPLEVPEILRGVDLYVGPSSEVEGFGLPALEAMGCGRACVLSDIGATRALDPRDEASIKFPVGNEEALLGAVRKLRDEPAHRLRLGRAGRRIAAAFTEERTVEALLAAFAAR
jgi:glycosyltransferase involved in cell wall biosynthesis